MISRFARIAKVDPLKVLTVAIIPLAVLWSVVYPFSKFLRPIGWDTPHYLGYSTSIIRYGLGHVLDPMFIQWKGIRVAPVIPLLPFLAITGEINSYILWVSLLVVLYLASIYYISRQLLRKSEMSFYSLLFASLSYNFIRSVRSGLFDQLLGLALMNFALGCSAGCIQEVTTQRWKYVWIFASQLLVWLSHLEIAVISSFILIVISSYAYLFDPDRRSAALKVAFPAILSSILGLVLWIPILPTYVQTSRIFHVGFREPEPIPLDVVWNQIQGPLVILGLVSVFHILFQIKRHRANMGRRVLLAWVLAVLPFVLLAYYLNPRIVYRILFLLPFPLLFSYGTDLIISTTLSSSWKLQSKRVHMSFGPDFRKGLAVGVFISVLLFEALVAGKAIVGAKSYISRDKVTALKSLADYVELHNMLDTPLVIILYPAKRITHPIQEIEGWVSLYDDWVQVYVGHHLTYYGSLQSLFTGEPIQTASYEEEFVFQYYRRKFKDSMGNHGLDDCLVIFLPDWYDPIGSYETENSEKVDNHFYVVRTEGISS